LTAANALAIPSEKNFPKISPIFRRQHLLWEENGLTVLADYAHHPREIAALLRHFGNSRTAVVFQSHRYSRTRSHFAEFVAVLRDLPQIAIVDTYGAFEPFDIRGTGEALSAALSSPSHPVPCLQGEELYRHLDLLCDSHSIDRILFIGAGSLFNEGEIYANLLRVRLFRRLCARHLPDLAIREDRPLCHETTFRIGGNARFFAEPANEEDLKLLLECAHLANLRHFLLGNGSNLLVADDGFFGLILRLRGRFWEQWEINGPKISVGAGIGLPVFARRCAKNSLEGFEFCAHIPGTLGGAIRMNAGAWGKSVGDFVESVDYMEKDGQIRRGEVCQFSYRRSSIPSGAIVLRAHLKKISGVVAPAAITQKTEEMAQWRRARQPLKPSAGSVFRNPDGKFAGQLIDACGLRGVSRGRAQIFSGHGNFIVNNGGATAGDVLALIYLAKNAVYRRFAIDLKPEIGYLSNHGSYDLE
jgi:UDP-N-acetylenolpyruvoylglucosamine reductase